MIDTCLHGPFTIRKRDAKGEEKKPEPKFLKQNSDYYYAPFVKPVGSKKVNAKT